ncbi:UPF0158 family protein [Arthrobacter sp. VKM Ac-2550]|uniref:UPF0158 family protein n=1 Tax=Crystallibacter permensis TaxID=1938888 RepID=UPI002227AFFA|nr:UPF0158 family protein [Arthrobacter sp. VKM Ac-2550]MCW2134422.1 Uncharacterized protein family (UPF0158) [Arthrobacter sp. VKM Ac-2550]
MLSLKNIDMDMLTTAMENASYDMRWWLDRDTGELEMSGDMVDEGLSPEELEERDFVVVEADSHRSYRDMEDFIATLEDERVRAALFRAIERNRPFRHFKDALYDYPKVQEDWYAFHEKRMRHHAITWLLSEGLIDEQEAQGALGTEV